MTDTKQFRFRSFLPFALAVLAVVAACEGALRVSALRERLPLVSAYYVAEVETQAALLADALEELGRVDVLFTGSSVVGHGVHAELFDREVARLTGQEVRSFNGWQCALMPSCVEFYLHHFWFKRVRPKTLVQGVRLLYLRSDYRPGEHAALKCGRYERLWLDATPPNRVRLWGLDHVALYRYRGSLQLCLTDFSWPPWLRQGLEFDSRGGIVHGDDLGAPDLAGLQAADPEREGTRDFIVYRGTPSERYPQGLAALYRVGDWCRSQGIAYVLVNMPEHADRFAGTDGEAIYRAYLADLRRVANEVGGAFVDVTDGDVRTYGKGDFGPDRVHMNAPGGERFTRALAAAFSDSNVEN